jgi:hypothetical protein
MHIVKKFIKQIPFHGLLLGLWMFQGASSADEGSVKPPARPNVIVILADDLGAEGPGCYGSAIYTSPNLDRMAAEGLRFNNAYATPLCTPTRVMLMSGLYPNQTGFKALIGKVDEVRLPASIKNDFFVREKRFRLDRDGVLYDIPVTSHKERYSEARVPKEDFSSDRQRLGAILDKFKSIEPESKPPGKSKGKRSKEERSNPTCGSPFADQHSRLNQPVRQQFTLTLIQSLCSKSSHSSHSSRSPALWFSRRRQRPNPTSFTSWPMMSAGAI